MSTSDRGMRRVVDMSNHLAADNRMSAHRALRRVDHRPRHLRDSARYATEHFAIEVFDDLGTALLPPHVSRRDLLAVLQRQDFRKVWKWIGRRFVVVRVIGCGLVAARTRTQRADAELRQHVLVVLGRRPLPGIG